MKTKDFEEDQSQEILKFLKSTKECIGKKKISCSHLIYLISSLVDDNSETIFTKSNRVLLRDILPKRKRIELDFLIKKLNDSS